MDRGLSTINSPLPARPSKSCGPWSIDYQLTPPSSPLKKLWTVVYQLSTHPSHLAPQKAVDRGLSTINSPLSTILSTHPSHLAPQKAVDRGLSTINSPLPPRPSKSCGPWSIDYQLTPPSSPLKKLWTVVYRLSTHPSQLAPQKAVDRGLLSTINSPLPARPSKSCGPWPLKKLSIDYQLTPPSSPLKKLWTVVYRLSTINSPSLAPQTIPRAHSVPFWRGLKESVVFRIQVGFCYLFIQFYT